MNIKRFAVTLTLFAGLVVSPEMAQAQVFDSGPSDPALFTTVINVPADREIIQPFEVIGDGTQINLADGGIVGFEVTANFGSEVNISGGYVSTTFWANTGSEVNISGGTIDSSFTAASGSEVNISGGAFIGFTASSGSVVNVSGGNLGTGFATRAGSEVNISGGALGDFFLGFPGSDVELIGGEFRVNGVDFTGDTFSLTDDDVFTGTLADGSSFIFSNLSRDDLNDVTLTVADLPPIDTNPTILNAPIARGPSGLRAGQELTVVGEGALGSHFSTVDATLNVQGGTVGERAEVYSSLVNISGGTVGSNFRAFSGSVVNISGGTMGRELDAYSGSIVNISGGTVENFLGANSGSVVNIRGGTVGQVFARRAGFVNISGGTVGERFQAQSGSVVNIFGSEFSIDGNELDTLLPGEAITITNRDVTLSGLLANGEPFSFDLNSAFVSGEDIFDPSATLTVTLGSPVTLGDVNLNGVVDFSDIPAFIEILITGEYQAEADCNQDGVVDFFDIPVFIEILLNT